MSTATLKLILKASTGYKSESSYNDVTPEQWEKINRVLEKTEIECTPKWSPIEKAPINERILICRDDGSVEVVQEDDNVLAWQPYAPNPPWAVVCGWMPCPASWITPEDGDFNG